MSIGHRLADGLEDGQETREIRGWSFTSLKRQRRLPHRDLRWRFRLVTWTRGPTLRQQRRQRPALHQLHREIGPAVGEGAQLIDRHDPWVLKLAADLGLLDEPMD